MGDDVRLIRITQWQYKLIKSITCHPQWWTAEAWQLSARNIYIHTMFDVDVCWHDSSRKLHLSLTRIVLIFLALTMRKTFSSSFLSVRVNVSLFSSTYCTNETFMAYISCMKYRQTFTRKQQQQKKKVHSLKFLSRFSFSAKTHVAAIRHTEQTERREIWSLKSLDWKT